MRTFTAGHWAEAALALATNRIRQEKEQFFREVPLKRWQHKVNN